MNDKEFSDKAFIAVIWLLVGMVIGFVFSANVQAYDIMDRWGPPHEGNVQVNFYDGLCTDSQALIIEASIQYAVNESDRLDADRSYTYLGRIDQPGWDEEDDRIVTFDCATPDLLPPFHSGIAIPGDNCSTAVWGNFCADGSPRFVIDGSVRINILTPDYRLARTTLHEYGHAVHQLDHSTVPGATMTLPPHMTPLSAQLMETWSRDDYCGIKHKTTMTEWPIKTPRIDDESHLHVPWAMFLGLPWEFVMLKVGPITYEVAGSARQIQPCLRT